MQIKMTSTQIGSVDGIRASTYVDGESYDLTGTEGARDLARAFVDADMAVEVTGTEDTPEDKSTDGTQERTTRRGKAK